MSYTLLCDSCSRETSLGRYHVGAIGVESFCGWCGRLASLVYQPEVNDPRIAHWGQMSCSSSVALDRVRVLVFDVNGYYRYLGLPTDATRLQIRQRYQEIEGWGDPRATYIVKVLLDPKKRASYDATPVGHLWYDRFLREAARKRSTEEAAHQRGLLDEDQEVEEYERAAEEDPVDEVEEGADVDMLGSNEWHLKPRDTGWGYYAWATPWAGLADLTELPRIRNFVIEALAERGIVTDLSFGFAGQIDEPWVVERVGLRWVVFLRRETCFGPESAAKVAEHLASGVCHGINTQES